MSKETKEIDKQLEYQVVSDMKTRARAVSESMEKRLERVMQTSGLIATLTAGFAGILIKLFPNDSTIVTGYVPYERDTKSYTHFFGHLKLNDTLNKLHS